MTYYIDLEEYDKGRAVVEDYVSELSSQGASEIASNIKTYVLHLVFRCCLSITHTNTIYVSFTRSTRNTVHMVCDSMSYLKILKRLFYRGVELHA